MDNGQPSNIVDTPAFSSLASQHTTSNTQVQIDQSDYSTESCDTDNSQSDCSMGPCDFSVELAGVVSSNDVIGCDENCNVECSRERSEHDALDPLVLANQQTERNEPLTQISSAEIGPQRPFVIKDTHVEHVSPKEATYHSMWQDKTTDAEPDLSNKNESQSPLEAESIDADQDLQKETVRADSPLQTESTDSGWLSASAEQGVENGFVTPVSDSPDNSSDESYIMSISQLSELCQKQPLSVEQSKLSNHVQLNETGTGPMDERDHGIPEPVTHKPEAAREVSSSVVDHSYLGHETNISVPNTDDQAKPCSYKDAESSLPFHSAGSELTDQSQAKLETSSQSDVRARNLNHKSCEKQNPSQNNNQSYLDRPDVHSLSDDRKTNNFTEVLMYLLVVLAIVLNLCGLHSTSLVLFLCCLMLLGLVIWILAAGEILR